MSFSKLHIIVIGCGDPIPSFILRRLNSLALHGVRLTVFLKYGQKADLHPDIKVFRQGGWNRLNLRDVTIYIFRIFINLSGFIQLYLNQPNSNFITRLKATIVSFPLSLARDVDVIHVQWLSMADSHFFLKKLYKVPLITSVRGSQATVYPLTRRGYEETVRRSLQHADAVHLVSSDLVPYCIKYGADETKLFVNYNGIDLVKFCPPQQKLGSSLLRLISVGALMWRKAFIFQLQILKELKLRSVDAQLNIVGDGPDREGLQYLVFRLGIDDRVFFSGRCGEEEVIAQLQHSDVYLSSSAAEGLPNSLVEAAACGLPIVSFTCEGVGAIVDDKKTGYLVAYGDISMAATRIMELQDITKRTTMGMAGRKKMEAEFDENIWVDKMINTYQHIVQSVTHE